MKVSSSILNVISRSPIKPLQQHMSEVLACVEILAPFFTEAQAGNWAMAEQHQHKIVNLTDATHALKKDLKLHLPTTLLLPVNREDLITMINLQSSIANQATAITTQVLGRQLQFPEGLTPHLMSYLQQAISATAQANEAIQEFDNLLETGFYGKEVKLVEIMLEKLEQIENDTSELQTILQHDLYQIEKNLPPIDVMFMYKIIEWVGELSVDAQAVGEQLQLMLAS
jgi:predicted phosphate transport protein (TIGR00153 family)